MTVKARIAAIRLIKKIEQHPEYATKIGLVVNNNETKKEKEE